MDIGAGGFLVIVRVMECRKRWDRGVRSLDRNQRNQSCILGACWWSSVFRPEPAEDIRIVESGLRLKAAMHIGCQPLWNVRNVGIGVSSLETGTCETSSSYWGASGHMF